MATTEPIREKPIKEIKGTSHELPPELVEKKAPEITAVQQEVKDQVGEQIYPKEKVPTFTNVRAELDALKAQQNRVINAIDRNPTFIEKAGTILDHRNIAKSVTAVSIAENQSLLNELRAGDVPNQQRISEFNQKRVEGYAGAIGNASKSILGSLGQGAGEFFKGLGGAAKSALTGMVDVAAYTGDKLWFGTWKAWHRYKQDKQAIKNPTK